MKKASANGDENEGICDWITITSAVDLFKLGDELDFEKLDNKPLLFNCEFYPDANEKSYLVAYLLSVLKCADLKIIMAELNLFIGVKCTKQCVNNENCLKYVFCSRYLHKDYFVTKQTLSKNIASDKSETACMPCSTIPNIKNLTDISAHDLIESNTRREPDNVVLNSTSEDFFCYLHPEEEEGQLQQQDFFDNCAYYDQKSLSNLEISTKGLFIIHFNIRNLQKILIA